MELTKKLDVARGLLIDSKLELEKKRKNRYDFMYEIEMLERAFYEIEEVLENIKKENLSD